MTGETNRRTNEEKALLEEEKFADNLAKVELRESRALCSSLRMKLKFYGEEITRLRYTYSGSGCKDRFRIAIPFQSCR